MPGPPLRAARLLLNATFTKLGAGILHHGVPLASADGAARRGEGYQKRHWILDFIF